MEKRMSKRDMTFEAEAIELHRYAIDNLALTESHAVIALVRAAAKILNAIPAGPVRETAVMLAKIPLDKPEFFG
jgi:hypothetical protein